LVDRDFAAVLKDCNSLEMTGFIRLEDKDNSRKSKAPTLSFPYTAIHVFLPTNAYQIKFDLAARYIHP
jgi:predicted transcriptional regulator